MAQDQYAMPRPVRWPLIVLALLVGVVIGLTVGWEVLPVKWYDTDPSDLRVQHQMTYCMMVADSLVVTGDVDLAKQRLMELTDDDTSWEQVADLVQRAALERKNAGDDASALRLQRMAQALGMPAVQAAPFEAPRKQLLLPSRNVLYLAAIIVFLAAMALVIVVVVRLLGQAHRREEEELPREERWGPEEASAAPPAFETGSAGPAWAPERAESLRQAPPQRSIAIEPVEIDLQGEREEDARLYEPKSEVDLGEEEDELYKERDELEPEPPRPLSPPRREIIEEREPEEEESLEDLIKQIGEEETEDEFGEEPEEEAPEPEPHFEEPSWPEPSPAARQAIEEIPEAPFDALGVFQAEYRHGDDAFDCSFSIESDGEFLGECGVGISEVLSGSGDEQMVDALELWLFDKGDIRTVSRVIVSEYAYGDESLRNRLIAKGELVVAQPGATVQLETKSLQLTATITRCEYAPDDDMPNSYFLRLDMELVAERADAF